MLISASRAECTMYISSNIVLNASAHESRGAAKKHSYKWNEQQLTELGKESVRCRPKNVIAYSLSRRQLWHWHRTLYAGRRITKSILRCILFVSLCDHVLQHFGRCSVDIFASSYFRFVLFQFEYISICDITWTENHSCLYRPIEYWIWNARLPTHIE